MNSDIQSTDIPEAVIKQKSWGISAVWVIPIIAALIGGWLVFQSAVEEKATAEISFKNAAGIEVGKTAVKFRNITIGKVIDITVPDDLASVIVVIELDGVRQERLTDSTRFWVVKPRIGAGGVSGLDTLVSGAYIEVDPGEGGQPVDKFVGLEEPQRHQIGNPGTAYVLIAQKLRSLSRGAPVKFRGIKVGSVTRHRLAEDNSHVEIEIFVDAPYDKHIKQTTRFWNVSGLSVKIDADGIKLGMDSVASLLAGGVAFSTENDSDVIAQAENNSVFTLHDTEVPEAEETLAFRAPMKIYFDRGVNGLSVGAPVEFKGLRLGTVVDVGVEVNVDAKDVLIFAKIDMEPERLLPVYDRNVGLSEEQIIQKGYQFIESMVNKGLRAQLRVDNILTGRAIVALDIFPGAETARLKYVDGVPIIPSVSKTLLGLVQQLEQFMARIDSLPIESIGENIEQTTSSFNSLARSLNEAEGGMMGVRIGEMMEEMARASRSIRAMSEYLERHPEALIHGKRSEQ